MNRLDDDPACATLLLESAIRVAYFAEQHQAKLREREARRHGKRMPYPTQEKLRRLFDYDPETGLFRWKVSLAHHIHIGDVAGSLGTKGYIDITIKRERYKAHRLAWIYCHGDQSLQEVDHINGKHTDIRISNLRECTRQQNNFNRPKSTDNTSGYKGVSWHKRVNKWKATICIDGKLKHLGYYPTAEKAAEAYKSTAREHHGPFLHSSLGE